MNLIESRKKNGERMKAIRVIEFWTGYPNKPTPTKEEKLQLLSQYRSGDVTIFERRLGAYNLPNDISDEQLINWD
ncbi:hypothetical protein H6768_05710 [Candidatus Peribacteria bacterium]|nr:hypothetical protein [Candidatus Peribacteria bacterium]